MELEWDLGEKTIRFCGTCASWKLGAAAEPVRPESPWSHNRSEKMTNCTGQVRKPTLQLSTTPAGHCEIDLLSRNSGVAIVNSPTATPGNTLMVLARSGDTSHLFREGRALALRPASSYLKVCQIRGFTEKWKDTACISERVCHRLPLMISSVSWQRLLCGNTWKDPDLCASS